MNPAEAHPDDPDETTDDEAGGSDDGAESSQQVANRIEDLPASDAAGVLSYLTNDQAAASDSSCFEMASSIEEKTCRVFIRFVSIWGTN